MKDWKNPELKRELWLSAGLALLLAGLCLPVSPLCALAALATALIYTLLHAVFVHRRYRALEALSASIDRILHGQDALLADQNEGELAILHSEIRKMTLRLKESSDRLAADKQVLARAMADVSHQLRTPLTSMNLTVSLLAREGGDEAVRLRLTRELKQALGRIDWLVETLLKLSRLDAGVVQFEPETLGVPALIERAARELRIPMELRGQQLLFEPSDAVLTVDPAWTAEALGNILKNCMEHTPEGGTVRVRARQTLIFTELTVTDTGPGIAPDDLPHLFERFYRGKGAGEHSVGIGLSLARQIITAQDGTVQATNVPSGGAQFTIRFYRGVV